jgi:hypothetical protein
MLFLAACSGERGRPPASTDSTRVVGCGPSPWRVAGGATEPRAGHLIQLGAFTDSARAAALRDSLAGAGWTALTRAASAGGRALTRVHLVPPQGAEMPRLVAFALRRAGRQAVIIEDRILPPAPSILVVPVNRGTHGMSATTRWTLSPDGCAMLVEEDPTAVEAEALPNGFLFATDVGPFLLQQDSVWDVAPSPDWSRLAYGRGYVVHAGERDSLATSQWDSLAARTGLPRDSVRRSAFVSSGMAIAFGFAQPVVVDVSPEVTRTATSAAALARTARVAGGWRVGWTVRGDLVAVGTSPKYVQDYTPSPSWLSLDPVTLQLRGPLPSEAMAPVPWTEGPVLDISVPVDTVTARPIMIDGFTIASAGGWITIATFPASGPARVIGPGIALAATRSGRFIAALVPWPDAGEFDQPARLVVYQVTD